MKVLVLNCGSSSIKYKLFDMTSGEVMAQDTTQNEILTMATSFENKKIVS